jgi:hypothetical protein
VTASGYSPGRTGRTSPPGATHCGGKLLEIVARHWQPPEGGFADVKVLGRNAVPDALDEITGPPTARGDIPGHPKKRKD